MVYGYVETYSDSIELNVKIIDEMIFHILLIVYDHI